MQAGGCIFKCVCYGCIPCAAARYGYLAGATSVYSVWQLLLTCVSSVLPVLSLTASMPLLLAVLTACTGAVLPAPAVSSY